jgi:hypothetical protein
MGRLAQAKEPDERIRPAPGASLFAWNGTSER